MSTAYNNGDYSLLTNDSHGSMGNDNTYAKVTARRPLTKSIQHSNISNKGFIIEESIMINDVEIANNKGEFRARPISRFVYILALSQSECVNRYFVNKDW